MKQPFGGSNKRGLESTIVARSRALGLGSLLVKRIDFSVNATKGDRRFYVSLYNASEIEPEALADFRIEPEALADFRLNDSGDRLAPQAQITKSLRGDKLRSASMRGGVQREVSKIPG